MKSYPTTIQSRSPFDEDGNPYKHYPSKTRFEGNEIKKEPKRERSGYVNYNRAPLAPRGNAPVRMTLSENMASTRKDSFLSSKDSIQGIDKLAALIGQQSAKDYFAKVIENLLYDTTPVAPRYFCPRPTFHNNPAYRCTFFCPNIDHDQTMLTCANTEYADEENIITGHI